MAMAIKKRISLRYGGKSHHLFIESEEKAEKIYYHLCQCMDSIASVSKYL